eukprot:CAMPEP_0181439830 /NCGR_PEP_ID=MMETSP1110-20121109/22638_1 /TAXON_ID=174948 /ORGANISM="Symbiodinium sp., Strain CCMP421" /LENGTH=239 /DNA_ID=CAMNT_0023563583 /DNA_START=125 /DNA_END=844 /DNA_ORIENTATION=+
MPKTCSVDQAVVDDILQQAAQASAEAPNRALKRRVRQRLHKKLGAMLSCEEFGRAMDSFKTMEENTNCGVVPCAATNAPCTMTSAPCATTNAPACTQAVIAVPLMVPMMMRPMQPMQYRQMPMQQMQQIQQLQQMKMQQLPVQQLQQMQRMQQTPMQQQPSSEECAEELATKVQEAQFIDLMSETTMDDLDDDLDSGSEFSSCGRARATTLGSSHLPVERTFIQFDTRMHVRHRRSRSV